MPFIFNIYLKVYKVLLNFFHLLFLWWKNSLFFLFPPTAACTLRIPFPKINQMFQQCRATEKASKHVGIWIETQSSRFPCCALPTHFFTAHEKREVKHEVTFGELDLCSSGLFWPALWKTGQVSFSERLFLIRSPHGSHLNWADCMRFSFFPCFDGRRGFCNSLFFFSYILSGEGK